MVGSNTYHVVWRISAIKHLQELLDDIAQHDPHAARKYVDFIENRVGNLSQHPFIGTVFDDVYRMLVVRKHLVFYRVEEQSKKVIIVHVIYGGRDIETIVGRRS